MKSQTGLIIKRKVTNGKEVSFDEAVELAMQEETQKSIEDVEAKMNIFKGIYKLPLPMRVRTYFKDI